MVNMVHPILHPIQHKTLALYNPLGDHSHHIQEELKEAVDEARQDLVAESN